MDEGRYNVDGRKVDHMVYGEVTDGRAVGFRWLVGLRIVW